MQDIIRRFRFAVVQISTPEGNGTGFYLSSHDLIVTNEHVVRGQAEVRVDLKDQSPSLVPVLFLDPKHDLAFVEKPESWDLPIIELLENEQLKQGDKIVALGHPYGMEFIASQGIISKAKSIENGVAYIQTDAPIHPGNSGGPLVTTDGYVAGVNTFVVRGAANLGFALPVHYLKLALEEYAPFRGQLMQSCSVCANMVEEGQLKGVYCPECGSKMSFPKVVDRSPEGTALVVEQIIADLGKDIQLARRGPDCWEIDQGSAMIRLKYSRPSGFIVGDAHLCSLPKKNIAELYEFLLKENGKLPHLFFSIHDEKIILSVLIKDSFLHKETGFEILQQLLKQADYYDNFLVDKFGAKMGDLL